LEGEGGGKRSAYMVLVVKMDKKDFIDGRLGHGYEHKNGINFEEVGWGGGL